MIKDSSFFDKLKGIFTTPKEKEVYYEPRVNYCGPFELQAWITKWIPFHYVFPNINKSCFFHDVRYTVIFKNALDQRRSYFKLLLLKLIVDVVFLKDMLRDSFSSPLTIKYPWLVTFRTIMAFVFFGIVIFATPVFVYLFAKRHKEEG